MEEQKIIKVTHEQAVDIAMSAYIGEECQICGKVWNTLEELNKAHLICVGNKPLRFACKKCFNNKEENKSLEMDMSLSPLG